MILFLWVNNYRHIQKKGFNLSSKFEFEFILEQESSENIIGELVCKENQSIDLFKNGIKDIKLLVGENGAGKSTILEILIQNIMTSYDNKFDGFLVTDEYIFYRQNIIIKDSTNIPSLNLKQVSNHHIINYNRPSYKGEVKTGLGQIATTFLSKFSVVHYSPLLNTDRIHNFEGIAGSTKIWETNYWHYFDITTENMIVNDYYGTRTGSDSYYISGESELLAYKTNEVKRNLEFLFDENHGETFFKNRVQYVDFKLNDFYSRYWDSIDSYFKDENELNGEIEGALKFIEEKSFGKDKFDELESNLYKQFIYGVLKYEYNHQMNFSRGSSENALSRTINSFLESTSGRRNPRTVLENYLKNVNFLRKDYKSFFLKIKNLIDFIIKNDGFEGKDRYGFYISFDKKAVIAELINLLYYSLQEDSVEYGRYFFNFLSIEFNGLSSGEKSFLSLFSRLKYVSDNLTDNQTDIVLIFDEPEVGLHPQWQTMFIYYINLFLPKIFKNRNLQIIITTHSPIILSDLPKKNILFLEKNPNSGECIVPPQEDMPETFGSNIHTLYAHAFFLKDKGGAMGYFAKKEINELVRKIEAKDIESIQDIRNTIDIVGEPLLKNMLLEVFYKNFPDEKFKGESIDERIKYLENALEESIKIKKRLDENS